MVLAVVGGTVSAGGTKSGEVVAAAWAFFRQPDAQAITDQSDEIGEPASPTSEAPSATGSASTTADGSTSLTSATTATTADPDSSADVTVATTGSSTTGSSTTEGSSSTSASTTESTTTTTGSTSSTGDTTSSTGGTTSSSTSTTAAGPNRPTGLTATASADETEIQLSWSAPATGPDPAGYQVRRNGVTIRDDLTATTFVDRNVAPGTYTYAVRAIGDDGSLSPPSNSATITVGPLDVTAFTVNRQPTRVSVSFSANKCVTYRIRAVSADPGVPSPAPETGPAAGCVDSASVIIGGLDAGTDYQVNLVVTAEGEDPVSRVRPAPAP